MELKVRQADKSDLGGILSVARTCWKRMCPEVLESGDIDTYLEKNFNSEDISSAIDNPDNWFYVLEDSGNTVGFCQMERNPEETNVGIIKGILTLPSHQEYKTVYKLYQTVIKAGTESGLTEVELYFPECSRKWRDIFVKIGVEFEPWRKFEITVGSKHLQMWPGLLVIVPGC